MPQNPKKIKHANDNHQAQILPTDRMDFLTAIAMDSGIAAKESMAVRVAAVILKHRHNKTGTIVLKRQTIADEVGCSPSAVDKAVAVLKRQGWYEVKHVYAKPQIGCANTKPQIVANRYDPRWDQAAAVGGVWSIEDRRLCQNDETSKPERGDPYARTSKQNSVSLTQGSKPGVLNPLSTTHSCERAEISQGSGEDRPAGAPADDDLTAIVEKLEKGLPAYDPFDDHKPVDRERSRQGAIVALRKLLRIGWSVPEIESYLDAYRRDFNDVAKRAASTFHPCGKTLASHLWHLVTQCGPDRNDDIGEVVTGWKIPARLLPNAANENLQPPARRYGTYGGECGPDDVF
jgi:hypothetical protein